jgi:ATPase, YjeE family
MATSISHSVSETEAIGEAWGRKAEPGLVIALSGDLGAGKTQLVRGIARGLGFAGRVHSPTFTLVNQYEGGRLPLFHLDLYRLETPEQILSAGIEEYLEPAGVSVIEWAERIFGENFLPSQQAGVGMKFRPRLLRLVRIETLSETERRITYEDCRS